MGPDSYPVEPWDLHGHAHVGLWLVPRRDLPAPHSPATRAVTILGRGVVLAAFVVYEPPSALTYAEVMSTVLVRRGRRLCVSITHIWVDSTASRDGGRDLWAIPKQLADFDVDPHRSYTARGIGTLTVGRSRRLPWRLSVRLHIAQDRAGALVVSPVRGRLRAGACRARWAFVADGPVGHLAGRRPVLTLAARPFDLVFGRRR